MTARAPIGRLRRRLEELQGASDALSPRATVSQPNGRRPARARLTALAYRLYSYLRERRRKLLT